MTAIPHADTIRTSDRHEPGPRADGHGRAARTVASGLTIQLVSGSGSGATELGAFDSALLDAGIGNFNLICLSSVVPPDSEIVELSGPAEVAGTWGDRLYLVLAEQRTSRPGTEAWAGIGWVRSGNTGKGLFVEHHGGSRDQVSRAIDDSLATLVRSRPGERFGAVHRRVHGRRCVDQPVCALVAATYGTAGWAAP